MTIEFNKPHLTGKEAHYMYEAVHNRHISGNGVFTKRCHQFIEKKYGINKCLLTTSCTDALEMAAILSNIRPGDEVIMPAFTFVSTANAFVLRGAKIVFADSYSHNPNIDASKIEELITEKTKAIIPVHYSGVACDMDMIMELAKKYNLIVIEDAAQAIDSYYKGRPLGSIGHLGAYSFHETKNIISGEGGALIVNDKQYENRSEIIWEKGTNRAAFFRGEVNKYGWVDIGSSFLPSDITAAFLFAQLEEVEKILEKRKWIWNRYYKALLPLAQVGCFQLPLIPDYATINGHIFYLTCENLEERTLLINYLNQKGIHAIFHYLTLHQSPFFLNQHDGRLLPNAEYFTNCLVRLPLYHDLDESTIDYIVDAVFEYYENFVPTPSELLPERRKTYLDMVHST
ncbi:MAG: dTDP-4-amino-4,6-dideoxygalactose transaminase [Bacteroidetes bacterium]|nr:dTDP-4-amino-4,6-dideoxygalactose transaminase [Bacteroidota bacterium]